jgi:uncharacterized membrane protein YjjP (DUF1212 family)
MDERPVQLELLARAGRMLLEYNESTGEIHRALDRTARALTGEPCDVAVSYSGIAVTLGGAGPLLMPSRELRYNAVVQTRIHEVLDQVCRGDLDPASALVRLQSAECDAPQQPAWLAAIMLAAGAAALAALLGADAVAAAIAGVSTGLGLIARQWLHHAHFSLLSLPFAAAFIAGVVGGLAIRLEWTQTPGLALIVPCLMLVPGPHLINGLMDLIDNYLTMSIARLALALAILVAASLGLLIGVQLTLPSLPELKQSFKVEQLGLVADMLLAGVVTAAFAVYYKTSWPHVGLAVVGGAIGHGLRSLALGGGWSLSAATFLGGFSVGIVSAWMARSSKTPFAVIAFAGAVTMMPGLQMYAALRGAVQLARLQNEAHVADVSATLANAVQAVTVAGMLGLGLIVAARAVQALPGNRS